MIRRRLESTNKTENYKQMFLERMQINCPNVKPPIVLVEETISPADQPWHPRSDKVTTYVVLLIRGFPLLTAAGMPG